MSLVETPLPKAQEMEPQEISRDVLLEKYAKNGEASIRAIHLRVARAIASVEIAKKAPELEDEFLWALDHGFVPAGRIQSAAGTDIEATLINCFVQPVGDSVRGFENGRPGIYVALEEAAETMRRGGGVGYDFSSIRPNGARVKGTNSRASGPLSFMHVFNASCSTVESAGARRGAQMGVLRCDHPDIERFIRAKDGGDLSNFNLSIGVTDAFMHAVAQDEMFELVHAVEPGDKDSAAFQRADGNWVYQTVSAKDLWEQVMLSTYDHAEPGIIFLDRMNEENNLAYCEVIEATNPCAEEPLPPYGCCCLGSVDLTQYVVQPFSEKVTFDFETLARVVRSAIRMLDNVLDLTFWPLPQHQAEALAKRRIGLGFLGLGDALVMLNLRYDTQAARDMAARITEVMRDESYKASVALAAEKGSFPLLDADLYLKSGFASRLPPTIQKDIRGIGLRNSHLMAIAPTGTIALAFADNASNGIEPAFSWSYNRKKRLSAGGHKNYEVLDHAWRLYRHLGGDVENLPNGFVTALEMSADSHMQMLTAVQPFVDTSISKTVNVPADYSYADFQNLYMDAWRAGLKGLATYRPNSILGSVLSVSTPAAPAPVVVAAVPAETLLADVDPLSKVLARRPIGDLPSVTSKVEYWTSEGKKTDYLSVSFVHVSGVLNGQPIEIERPVEFFMPASEGQQWIAASMRLLSLNARSGGSVAKALQNLREVSWDKGTVRCGEFSKMDGTKVPLFHDSVVAALGHILQRILIARGFLDDRGNQVPVSVLAKHRAQRVPVALIDFAVEVASEAAAVAAAPIGTGRKCPDCGAHALHRRDGCESCGNCGYLGSCG